MVDEKEVVIIIDEKGEISIDAIGFHGKGCAEATKYIAEALGDTIQEKKKGEYYESVEQKEISRVRQ